MAKHNQTGKTGEELAAEYLIARGYIIRDINWKNGKLELDIVAYKDQTLIVVEVKTRSSDLFGHPEDAVNTRKRRDRHIYTKIRSPVRSPVRYYFYR